MKRRIIIATFFAIIMLLLPAASAVKTNTKKIDEDFEIPLGEEDEKEIRTLISNEENEIENELNKILTDEGKLKIEELANIYEDYIDTGDSSVIDSDSWSWILDRLGWIYFTMEQAITIYYDAITLYNEITEGAQVFQDWYQSISNFRSAWQNFINEPLNFDNIYNLLTSAINLLQDTIDVLEYLSSQELIDAMGFLIEDIQEFVTFLQNDPWNEPITIYGSVTGVDDTVTISVKSDSVTTTDEYNLSYTTADAALSWFVHRCQITAEYKDKSFTKNRFAFSMGKIEFNINEEDFNAISKEKTDSYNIFIFSMIHVLFSKIFKNMDFKSPFF